MQFFDNTVEGLYSRNISSWIKFYSFIINYRGVDFNEALNLWNEHLTKEEKTGFIITGQIGGLDLIIDRMRNNRNPQQQELRNPQPQPQELRNPQ